MLTVAESDNKETEGEETVDLKMVKEETKVEIKEETKGVTNNKETKVEVVVEATKTSLCQV
jgi:hypothetical protein